MPESVKLKIDMSDVPADIIDLVNDIVDQVEAGADLSTEQCMVNAILADRARPPHDAKPVAYMLNGIPHPPARFPAPWRNDPAKHGLTPLYASPSLAIEALREALTSAINEVLEERARYFDRTQRSHYDREQAARSYRATKAETTKAIDAVLKSLGDSDGR